MSLPETEESLPGGKIIIPQIAREKYAANQFLVVSVGEEEVCEWPEDCERMFHRFESLKLCVHPLDERVRPGAWVVVRPRSLVDARPGEYLIKQTDVLAVFRDTEALPKELTKMMEAVA